MLLALVPFNFYTLKMFILVPILLTSVYFGSCRFNYVHFLKVEKLNERFECIGSKINLS